MDTKVFFVDRWKSLRPENFTIKGKCLEGNLVELSLCEDENDDEDFLLGFDRLCFSEESFLFLTSIFCFFFDLLFSVDNFDVLVVFNFLIGL